VRLRPHIRRYQPGDENDTSPPDPASIEWMLAWLAPWQRYHRYTVEGLEHVPRTGPALIAGFHAFTIVDVFLLAREIYLRDGRLVRALTDKLMFRIPGVRDLFRSCGIVAGTPENGRRLLDQGELLGVMPGGGLEWARSSSDRGRMRWGDHRGYARLAIRAQVPIIPTACPAADRAYLLPLDGWRLGEMAQRLLGLDRVVPLPIAFGLIGLWPFPVRLTQHVAAPIVPSVPPEMADDPEAVSALDRQVRDAIAGLLVKD
jgi:1-acyl-sn-glycerol-3-phosphate acyltransferase